MRYQVNPPWVAKLLKEVWPTLVKKVTDQSLLPKDGPTTKDYGCGHYGCVLPTGYEDGLGNEIVCKITTDTSEAQFIQAALLLSQQDPWPVGMIRYLGVYRIPNKQFRKRPVYVIWREGAPDAAEVRYPWQGPPGAPEELSSRDVDIVNISRDVAAKLRAKLGATKNSNPNSKLVQEMFRWLKNTAGIDDVRPFLVRNYEGRLLHLTHWLKGLPRGAQGAARLFRLFDACCQEMQNKSSTAYVGEALGYYLHEGILLADVHMNNIRLATPEDFSSAVNVISDPGHMVSLDPRWDDLWIPEL